MCLVRSQPGQRLPVGTRQGCPGTEGGTHAVSEVRAHGEGVEETSSLTWFKHEGKTPRA